MELFLNLAWALLALVGVCLWLRFLPQHCAHRKTQLVALALLVLVLFPVISVTDDLQAMQNPAEVDSSQRRDHIVSNAHPALPPIAALPPLLFSEIPLVFLRSAAPGKLPARVFDLPALASIQNRPPPAA
jgi:hypothetical protein